MLVVVGLLKSMSDAHVVECCRKRPTYYRNYTSYEPNSHDVQDMRLDGTGTEPPPISHARVVKINKV